MRVAIMQPTYLPWSGYLSLIDEVDTFVFLDDAEFSAQSWQQRNRVKGPDGAQWLTVPVRKRGRADQLIREARINQDEPWQRRHVRTIFQLYARAPYMSTHRSWLDVAYGRDYTFLLELNLWFVSLIMDKIGIQADLLLSSEMPAKGKRADRLVSICEHLGAEEYLSPLGSFDYLDKANPFPSAGIRLVYQQFTHPVYHQLHGSFESHLSVLDLLLNEGPNSLSLIRSGQGEPCSHEEVREPR